MFAGFVVTVRVSPGQTVFLFSAALLMTVGWVVVRNLVII